MQSTGPIKKTNMIDIESDYISYEIIDDKSTNITLNKDKTKLNNYKLVESLRNDIIGSYNIFNSPFGKKPLIYADWTASGRCLQSIESFIYKNVLCNYGNTHTGSSRVGLQSTSFRHESRQIIAQAVNAKITGKAAEDVVLFTGSGTTSAVNKLVQLLGLNDNLPNDLDSSIYRPVIFISSYEHHSNILPFRESVAHVVTIAYHSVTGVDLSDLQEKLVEYDQRILKIGAFSAASNVTGILTDVNSISILMHKAGGLVFFDYATAAPYVKMDMNPVIIGEDSSYVYKDGIYFSGHKFLGGPGTPGVLIVKKTVLPGRDEAPSRPGGGTVFYVTDNYHRYLSNREEREEGGTPDIIGDIKLGLALHTKQMIDINWIEQEEYRISNYIENKLSNHPNILLLGRSSSQFTNQSTSYQPKKLPIFSFLIKYNNKFLHYNFICVLLNDLFGIQTRGGCQCAGPFSQLLLGISQSTNKLFEKALLNKQALYRPGFTRFSAPYWMTSADVDYLVDSVLFLAENAWKYLHLYRFNPKTGEYSHTSRFTKFPDRIWLSNLSINSNNTNNNFEFMSGISSLNNNWNVKNEKELCQSIFYQVETELIEIEKSNNTIQRFNSSNTISNEWNDLLWFILPDDLISSNDIDECSFDGPINPSNEEKLMEISKLNNQSNQLIDQSNNLSNYELNQNNKMKARYNDKLIYLPRYINIIPQKIKAKLLNQINNLDDNNNLLDTNNRIVQSDKSDEKLLNDYDHIEIKSNENNILWDKNNQITQSEKLDYNSNNNNLEYDFDFIVTKSETKDRIDDKSDIINESDLCTTNSCMKQRKLSTSITDKVQSGEGIVYLPKHSPIYLQSQNYPKKLLKLVGQAIKEWNMINEGDRLLLGLSGGKDSLCLLHILLELQKRSPIKFELSCATVDPQTESYNPSPLIDYCQSIGVKYHYLSEPIVELAKTKLKGDSLCAFCSRFKRGLLYSCCRNNNYNKLVLAQHLDDLVESFMMSILHNGQLRTMKANYVIDAMDISVVRPLIYVRETQTRDFSIQNKLPVINENCPVCFEQPKERARVKQLLLQEEYIVPNLYYNLRHSLIPLMDNKTYDIILNKYNQIDELNRNTNKNT